MRPDLIGTDPVVDYLMSAGWARVEASRLREKLDQMEAQVTRVTPSYTGMPGGGNGDSSDAWVALAQLRGEYAAKLAEVERSEREVSDFIDSLESSTSRAILHLRYCSCLRWPIVVERMEKAGYAYSERQIHRLHNKALEEARVKYMEEARENSMEGR